MNDTLGCEQLGWFSGIPWVHSYICSWLRAGWSRMALARVVHFTWLLSLWLANPSWFTWQLGRFPSHCPHSFEQIKKQGPSRFEELGRKKKNQNGILNGKSFKVTLKRALATSTSRGLWPLCSPPHGAVRTDELWDKGL